MTTDERKRGLRAMVGERVVNTTLKADWHISRDEFRESTLWEVIDSLVDECSTHEQQIQEILVRAYKYDDKPHQLYSGIAALARKYPDDLTEEIVRLMDQAYEKA